MQAEAWRAIGSGQNVLIAAPTGSGKTTLTQAVEGRELSYRKTQAVSYSPQIVDTPGEFVENRRLYSNLVVTANTCNIVGFVQDATAIQSIFPPRFATMFTQKQVVGIITKTDLEAGDIRRAEKFLDWAGAKQILVTSSVDRSGIGAIHSLLAPDPES